MNADSSGNSYAPGETRPSDEGGRRPRPLPLILGHRGSPREAPENTLRSFDLALRAGADGVELDVRPSRDGVAVVTHDDSLERVMGARGAVSALDWAAIERLTGARVPSFEQTVAWAAASGAWLNVEVKAAGVEAEVVRRIRETRLEERVVLSSFDPSILARIASLDAGLLRYFLTERWNATAQRRFRLAAAAGVCLRVDAATPANLARLGDLRLPVIVWTVNDRARMETLLRSEVAGIISDDPRAAAEVRAAQGDR